MSDLIRRDAVIEKMRNHRRLFCKNHMEYSILSKDEKARIDEIDNFIACLLNEPKVEPEQEWIPITERLPINDVDVIVSVLDDSSDTPYRFTSVGWCTPNGQYWVVDNEMCYGVIAWMPLPEPYRGK